MAGSIVHTEQAPAAVGPYSQAVRTGNLLLTSGQLGLDPENGILPEGVEAQAEQSLKNIGAILEATSYLYVMVFGAVFFSEKPTQLKVAAIGLILVGVVVYTLGF